MKPKTLIFVLITLALLGWGFYQGMYAAPTEQTMGDIQRIFYYHVPSAWTAFLLFFINFGASAVYLVRRSPDLIKPAEKTGRILLGLAAVASALWPGLTIRERMSCILSLVVVQFLFWAISTFTNQEQA